MPRAFHQHVELLLLAYQQTGDRNLLDAADHFAAKAEERLWTGTMLRGVSDIAYYGSGKQTMNSSVTHGRRIHQRWDFITALRARRCSSCERCFNSPYAGKSAGFAWRRSASPLVRRIRISVRRKKETMSSRVNSTFQECPIPGRTRSVASESGFRAS